MSYFVLNQAGHMFVWRSALERVAMPRSTESLATQMTMTH